MLEFAAANPRGVALFRDKVVSGVEERAALPWICVRGKGNVAKKDSCVL